MLQVTSEMAVARPPGRPRKTGARRTTLSTKVTDLMFDEAYDAAKAQGMSLSRFVRVAVSALLAQHRRGFGKPNP